MIQKIWKTIESYNNTIFVYKHFLNLVNKVTSAGYDEQLPLDDVVFIEIVQTRSLIKLPRISPHYAVTAYSMNQVCSN